jgi:hypothetical protein
MTNLRKTPSPGQEIVTTVPAGDFLHVVGANKGWLEVRHPSGQGFVSGDLVEPALVKISKEVAFDAGTFEPEREVLIELMAALGSLGGLAIVDGTVLYPQRDSKIGFARAAAVRSFVQSLVPPPERGRSRVYVKVNSSTKSDVSQDTVLVTLLAVPLNDIVRATIANTMHSSSGVLIDLDLSRLPAGFEAQAHPKKPVPPPTICASGSQCVSVQVPKVANSIDLREGLRQVQNVQPPIKQPVDDILGIKEKLKLFRF